MLAALNLGALALGVAAGGLAASLLALALGGLLTVVGVEGGADIGLVAGVVTGFVVAGWVAGVRAVHSNRFHGQVSGLVLAAIVVAIARFGGSTAGTGTILWMVLIAIILSGVSGWLAGRRRGAPS